jgi:hypothetical protein
VAGAPPAQLALMTARSAEAKKNYAAQRAVEDPVKVDRAARIIRLAIERGLVTLADLAPSSREPE